MGNSIYKLEIPFQNGIFHFPASIYLIYFQCFRISPFPPFNGSHQHLNPNDAVTFIRSSNSTGEITNANPIVGLPFRKFPKGVLLRVGYGYAFFGVWSCLPPHQLGITTPPKYPYPTLSTTVFWKFWKRGSGSGIGIAFGFLILYHGIVGSDWEGRLPDPSRPDPPPTRLFFEESMIFLDFWIFRILHKNVLN